MGMCSSSKIVVDGLRVGLDIVSKIVKHFKGGFATDWGEVCSIEDGVLVIYRAHRGGLRQ